MSRRGGTIVFNGLPPGDFPASIFEIVLKGLTVRGSIVGTRQDMVEALDFYARGQIHPTVATRELDEINEIFDEMKPAARSTAASSSPTDQRERSAHATWEPPRRGAPVACWRSTCRATACPCRGPAGSRALVRVALPVPYVERRGTRE